MVQGGRLGGRLLQVCNLFQLQLHFHHRHHGSSRGRLRISIMGSVTNITKEKNYLSQSRHHHLSWPDHRFCINFTSLSLRKLKPPLVPKLKYEGDTSNFDDYPEDDLNKVPGVSEREQRIFDDF